MPDAPKAFFSYVRHVDQHDEGRLTRLRDRLQGEIRAQTGLAIEIFQDIRELKWGDRWEQRIMEAAGGSLFLIPVVTPAYFLSDPCRSEYEAFKKFQDRQQITGAVLPIHYIETEQLTDPAWRDGNAWAEDLAAGQWIDWRSLRLIPWELPEPHLRVEQMAKAFKERLKVLGVIKPPSRLATTTAALASTTIAPERTASVVPVMVEAGKSTSALPLRREVIIDAAGGGHFRTISDAVKAATADDVLLVRPGTYREAVSITKTVTLIGDGARESIVLEADNEPTIHFAAAFGRIANLTIRRLEGIKEDYAVWITSGRLELEGCDVSSATMSSIGVCDDADPTLRRNKVANSRHDGILFYGNSRGVVEDNDIFGNEHSGISICDNSDPVIRRNRVHGSKVGGGVHATEGGRGTIEDNDIFGSALAGISVGKQADPVVRRNRVHDSKDGGGVYIYEGGRGTIEDNDIFGNACAGLEVRGGGRPVVKKNRITKNKHQAVLVAELAGGTFEGNDLRDNGAGAWRIDPECVALVTRAGNLED